MWFDDATIYQIYPLGLCGAPLQNDGSDQTGEHRILRVLDWVEHIKKLGATCVLFNPLFDSDAHGYDTRDYNRVDPRLGTKEDFQAVCKALHGAGIRVMLDGVFNHVGRGFWAFRDVQEKKWDSAYKDWFHISFDGNTGYNDGFWYEAWEGCYELVKLNLRNPAGQSVIDGGEYDGLKFGEYLEKVGAKALGVNGAKFKEFPVLIKFIDAKQPLSVQVHPSDEYALRVEGEYGKTEMWYVVDCEPGASLYFGVNRALTKEEFKKRIEDNTLTDVLYKADVKKGDVFFIQSGTIHAIGAGILICEIQQNSNTTYRVYDYRRGADGKLRELHIDKAIDVSKLTPSDTSDKQGKPEEIPGGTKCALASCPYFTTEKYVVDGEVEIDVTGDSFASLVVTEGSGKVVGSENEVEFKPADSLFVPAGSGKIKINGHCTVVKTTV